MDISVIISTYNRVAWLEKTLQSVVAQTLPPREVILVDDGSTDNTGPWVQAHFPDVRYIYQSNRGVSAARNRGIREARGAWIALLDSDDRWLTTKLQRQASALAERPEYRLCHCDELWIRRGKRVNPMKKHAKLGGDIFQHCLPLCIISPSAALIHRSVFDKVGFFDESLPACEDYDLWLRICARWAVLLVNEHLVVKHGGHEDQLSRRYWGMDRFRIYALEKILNSGRLTQEDYRATAAMLEYKIRIYLQGAIKRNKEDDISRYQEKLERYILRASL